MVLHRPRRSLTPLADNWYAARFGDIGVSYAEISSTPPRATSNGDRTSMIEVTVGVLG
jgi:hypothetical protein